ncbi:hypothetical protein [Pollutibacter soli]
MVIPKFQRLLSLQSTALYVAAILEFETNISLELSVRYQPKNEVCVLVGY